MALPADVRAALRRRDADLTRLGDRIGAELVGLRDTLRAALAEDGRTLYAPPPRYCTDNAAMIAGAADFAAVALLGRGHQLADRSLNARATWPLAS